MAQVHQPGSEAWLQERDLERLQRHQHLWGRPPPPSAWHRHLSMALLAFLSLSGFAFPAPSLKSAAPRLHASQEGLRATQQRLTALSLVIVLEQRDGLTQALLTRTYERDQLQAKANDLQSQVDQLKQQLAAATVYQPTCLSCGGGGALQVIAYDLTPAPWRNRMLGGQCTWYIANRRYIPWLGNAWEWFGQAQAYGWAIGQTPRVNAIEVAWLTGWGHVAWVEAVIDSNTWVVTEMHYVGLWVVDRRLVHRGTENLIGFIY